MNQASETLFVLKPVTLRYKKAIDPARLLSFGLIAEDVAEISSELITRDKQGKPSNRALRGGERNVAERVSQRASQG